MMLFVHFALQTHKANGIKMLVSEIRLLHTEPHLPKTQAQWGQKRRSDCNTQWQSSLQYCPTSCRIRTPNRKECLPVLGEKGKESLVD